MEKSAEAWLHAGHLLEEKGRIDEARACYDEAARADPACADAWYDKARVLINTHGLIDPYGLLRDPESGPRKLGLYAEAHEYLQKAIACGHEQASGVELVLRGFSSLFAD